MNTNIITGTGANNELKKPRTISKKDFEILSCVGSGYFGKVYRVKNKINDKIYAMKQIQKKNLECSDPVKANTIYSDIMRKIIHPFILESKFAFHSSSIDYLPGGDLFSQLRRYGSLKEDQAKVYISQILLAVEYLHSLNMTHRSLKPSNILLNRDNNLALTDYCLTRYLENDDAKALCEINLYLAPEVIMGKRYDKITDLWSVGALLYEMLVNKPVFSGSDSNAVFRRITTLPIQFPPSLSVSCVHLLKGLMNRDMNLRLGSDRMGGIESIKIHPFFSDIKWDLLLAKKIPPPIKFDIPEVDIQKVDPAFSKIDMLKYGSPTQNGQRSPDLMFNQFLHPDLLPNFNLNDSLTLSSRNRLDHSCEYDPRYRSSSLVDSTPSENRQRSFSCLSVREGNKKGYRNLGKEELKQLLGILEGKPVINNDWARRLSVDELDVGYVAPENRRKRNSLH